MGSCAAVPGAWPWGEQGRNPDLSTHPAVYPGAGLRCREDGLIICTEVWSGPEVLRWEFVLSSVASGGFETTESNFHRRRKIKSQPWLANPKDPNLAPPVVRTSDSLSWPLVSASVAECMGKKC